MKKILILAILLTVMSCASGFLPDVSTKNLSYSKEKIYLNDVVIAELSATELSWDNGRIVTEVTFKLTSPKYNEYALNIIKLVHNHNPKLEIEIELDYDYRTY